MNEKSKKRKLRKFELLSLDYQEVCEIYEECETAFKVAFFDPQVEEQIKKQEEKENIEPKVEVAPETSNETGIEKSEASHEEKEFVDDSKITKKIVRKLFKAIALETHPDKLFGKEPDEIKDKEELYKKAARAVRRNDEHELLEIAVSLGITDILGDTEVFLMLDKAMMNLKNKSSQKKNSIFWAWFHSSGKERERIEVQLEKQLGLKKRNE